VFEANFTVHNVVTLFLTGAEIAALGALLNMNEEELLAKARDAQNTNLSYYYYVTGVPCAGKSTALSCLRSFTTYDEWLDARLPDMSKWPRPLPKKRVDEIDAWVGRQFAQKNQMLVHPSENTRIGIHVLDRCMLDPMSFKRKAERKQRAKTLLDAVCGNKRQADIQDGMIILLEGDATIVGERCIAAGKEFSNEQLKEMQKVLGNAYRGRGVFLIDARRHTHSEVIRSIVRQVFVGRYQTLNIKRRLEDIEKGKFTW